MCIIIGKPKGAALPPLSHIEKSWNSNSDGFGCLWTHNGEVRTYRTMDREKCMSFYRSIMGEKKWINTPMLFHFRFATHGSKCVSNCHAYHDDEYTVGFQHNGVLRFNVPIGMDITDSEYFFKYMFLPSYKMNGEDIEKISHVIDNLRGTSDKFAFIKGEELYMFGNFIKDNGCYYSNNGYKQYGGYDYYDRNYSSKKALPPAYSSSYGQMCSTCRTYDCMNCVYYD